MNTKGLYIHVPFCVRKCPYCDFYSVTDLSLREKYTEAVIRNIKAKEISADTIYFGGGTPSLLTAEQIDGILSVVDIAPDAEITMECNPATVTPQYMSDILAAGVNRVSIGVQSLNNMELRHLGRIHTSDMAVNAVNTAYEAGFRNISADLMLCTPDQTPETLKKTLDVLLTLPINHVSAYLLKIEEDTPFGIDWDIVSTLPSEDETADMYLSTCRILEEKGFRQYEISNFAQDGFESKHNLKYWRCEEYYGIGCTAHSYIDGVRTACKSTVAEFIAADTQPEYVTEDFGGDEEEKIMLALRLTREGLNTSALSSSFREKTIQKAAKLEEAGYIRRDGDCIMLTPKGCLVSNEIICELT
jgi:oxygen-independent coproporphyrinogen-3 oxidase